MARSDNPAERHRQVAGLFSDRVRATQTGQDDRLDPDFCAQLLGGMEQMEQVLRDSGQFGVRVEVPDGADSQTKLLGFIGRDPFWSAQ